MLPRAHDLNQFRIAVITGNFPNPDKEAAAQKDSLAVSSVLSDVTVAKSPRPQSQDG